MITITRAQLDGSWTWRVTTAPDGWGSTTWSVMTDRLELHPGTFASAINLNDVDPDQLDAFADALHDAARSIRYQLANPDEL